MQKSFKKAIACLLAVLMVAFAMPFSAFAAVGDYEPDVQLQFSSFFDANEQTDPTEKAASSADCFESAGLAAFPIQYDAATGTLKATKEDINTYNEYWESDPVDEDWVIGEDDIFAVTIRFDNVDIAASGNVNIRFSDNLSPAGLGTYTYKDGKKDKTGYIFCGDNTKPASFKNETAGFREPIATFSASTLYAGMNDTLIGDLSCIQEDPFAEDGDGWSDEMMTATLVCTGDYIDVSSIAASNGFFNIADGTYDSDNGYTYDGKFIVATFVFQYSGEGAIQFALQDPDGSLDSELNGASFFAKKSEGLAKEFATTYAPNGENPGSMKMTFMGKNTNKGEAPHEHSYTPVVTNPTCTEQGYTTWTCTCGDSYTDTYVDATGHSFTNYVSDGNATCKDDGTKTAKCDNCDVTDTVVDTGSKDAVEHTWDDGVVTTQPTESSKGVRTYTCSVCGATRTEDIDPLPHTHNYTPVVTNPTCTEQGYTTWTCTCGDSYTDTYVDATGHTFTNYVSDGNATCTADGTKTAKCENCDATDTVADEGSATGHSFTNYVPDGNATCTADGTKTAKCDNCDATDTVADEGSATGHTPAEAVYENETEATKKDPATAEEVIYCSKCKAELSRKTVETAPALGVTVTLNKSDIGLVEGLEVGANKLAYGTDITLTATPVEGAKFVGWEIGGNIVSNEATFTTKAAYDFTITPVFEDAAAATITVTFYDKYGNTIKQYKDMDVADYQAAVAAEFDSITAPTYPSYTFKEWDKSKDEILALDASTTIWAIYDKVEETQVPKYTVTTNADVILPAGIVNGEIPYDTQVTVRDTAAKAWKVGETTVAYGSEYTFYVGSDVAIDPVYETVVEKATTTVIGANLVAGSDYKFNIVATRNVPDGFTLVDYGFVYGKNLTDAELDLDKVGTQGANANAGAVKDVHAGTRNTESNEFAFNYGIKAKNAPVTAKSFVIVINKDGDTEIIYSDMFTQNY